MKENLKKCISCRVNIIYFILYLRAFLQIQIFTRWWQHEETLAREKNMKLTIHVFSLTIFSLTIQDYSYTYLIQKPMHGGRRRQ